MTTTAPRRRALVIGKFLPPHAGHMALIGRAGEEAHRVDVLVCDLPGQRPSAAERVRWLATLLPDARVAAVPDICGWHAPEPCPPGCSAAWAGHLAALGWSGWDVVVTSEPYGPSFAAALGVDHVAFDPPRSAVPVSGSAVRRDLAGQWRFLDPVVRAGLTRRLVVVGAESTGTTTLARDLAASLGCAWVPEYGRAYTEELAATAGSVWDVTWTAEDFSRIAAGQERLAEESVEGWVTAHSPGPLGPWLVGDTDGLATAVWQERYLGRPAPQLVERAVTGPARPAFYVLTTPEGVAFEQDGLRDGEHLRAWMTERFRQVLAEVDVPTIEVTGDRRTRVQAALDALTTLPPLFSDGLPDGG